MKIDGTEFARQVGELANQISQASLAYTVALALWPTPEAVDTMNRWLNFFSPARNACHVTFVMGFAKVADEDSRTMSLTNLIRLAKEDPPQFVPNLSLSDLEEMEDQIAAHAGVLESIKLKRNQHLAHLDAIPDPDQPLIKGDVDQLNETLKEVFNRLSRGFGGSFTDWSFMEKRAEEQTGDVLRILEEERGRKKTELERTLNDLKDMDGHL
jgi:hypothetical protein